MTAKLNLTFEPELRRCLRPSKHGCSQLMEISNFELIPYKQKDGSYIYYHCRRCITCQSAFENRASANKRRNASQAKGAEFNISDIGKYYFCGLKPVPMSQEIREARRLNV